MNKFLLRFAAPLLLSIIEPALRDALKDDIKGPDNTRTTLNKIGFGNVQIDAIDERVQKQVGDRVMREIERAVNRAVK